MERNKATGTAVALCALILILCPAGFGSIIYVDDDAKAPGDGSSWQTAYKFLQDALTAAEAAEKPVEIRVAQGIYKPDRDSAHPQGTGDRNVYFLLPDGLSLLGGHAGLSGPDSDARDIPSYETILSGDLLGNDAPVIDPAALMDDPTRDDNSGGVVRVTRGPIRLEGCTVAGGSGLALVMGLDMVVSDCTFRGNRCFGGSSPMPGAVAVYKEQAKAVLHRCSFIENAGDMGALEGYGVLVDGCRFTRNYGRGYGGGAAFLHRSTIINCVFTENRVKGSGGALRLGGISGTNRVVGCIFRGNRAGGGGAILCQGHSDVRDCIFVGNEATVGGGAGLIVSSSVDVTVSNCVLAGNRAGQQGGAWATRYWRSLEIRNCTIVGNRSARGPGLAVDPKAVFRPVVGISNCIVSNGGDDIWSNDSPVEIAYSCVPAGVGAVGEPNDWLVWGPGNIIADPCFVAPGYWDPNGTPDDLNDDFFVEGDYHLKSQAGRWNPASESWVADEVTSPCIDAGDPNSPIGQEPFPSGGRINMGAYGGTAEASKSYFGELVCETIVAGDINGDCKVDFEDFAILVRHWLPEQEE